MKTHLDGRQRSNPKSEHRNTGERTPSTHTPGNTTNYPRQRGRHQYKAHKQEQGNKTQVKLIRADNQTAEEQSEEENKNKKELRHTRNTAYNTGLFKLNHNEKAQTMTVPSLSRGTGLEAVQGSAATHQTLERLAAAYALEKAPAQLLMENWEQALIPTINWAQGAGVVQAAYGE